MRRYLVASIVAAALTAAGAFFVAAVSAYLRSLGVVPGSGIEMSSMGIWLVFLRDIMTDFWWFLVPLVFAVCLGIAALVGPARQNPVQ
jgi:hypothetical protein